jgi:RNA polymerase sigma-70 factor (ECF subfamily)
MAAEAPRGVRVQEPDPRVIRAAAQHDHVAFGEIVRAYQAQVWRFLRHLLADDALAEDLTQETFIRIYRKLHTFQFRSKFSTWVLNIARNAGTDELRARQRRARLVNTLSVPAPQRDPALRVEISDAIDGLTPKLREALLLVELLGLTYREAADVLCIPEGTAKRRVFDARRRLALELAEEGGEESAV